MPQTLSREPEVTRELARAHGLTDEEYDRILQILGRQPTYTELGMYAVMWSEHCSYKNSIAVLKTLPRSGGRLLVAAGEENAGLVDIGDGLAVAFKIESHNHPSAVEPYQGAATGVGGIHRDVFAMGARPIAALDSLRFGSLDNARVRYLFDGVVRGIADYGNAFGVPTVGGEIYFDPAYEGNPLVNVMSVGLVRVGQTARAAARGPGNLVMIVGSATGRDGIHGATFASEVLQEDSEAKRPNVQVGDPFTEKLLLEATLEALRTGAVVGLQDMGAAGLTCSSCETSARAGTGMRLYLERVPLREPDMSAYEILLSESQERMLLIVQRGREEEVLEVFRKWDLPAALIGEVTDTGLVEVYHHGELKAAVPASSLVLGGGAPVYIRQAREPAYLERTRALRLADVPLPKNLEAVFLRLLDSPNIASKRWVYEQYDTMVRTNTVVGPGPSDAAVVRIKGTRKALALKVDGNGRYVYLNPRRGAQIAVAEAARNVVCSGARALAITNCLNFGDPYNPEVYWTFQEAVAGIGEACRILGTPVTGGNVSFYNESPTGAIYPTPTIGMVGLIEPFPDRLMTAGFKSAGDLVWLLGQNREDIGGSEYLAWIHGRVAGDAPYLDLDEEKRLHELLLVLIAAGQIRSAHDVSDGGLAVALAESCLFGGLGARIWVRDPIRPDALLFGESQSRVIVSAPPQTKAAIEAEARRFGLAASLLGRVGGDRLQINDWIDLPLEQIREVYESAIPRRMAQ
ncbi:MAG: phosphoribosylformylglycinamidine synthase subunit PurL [Bacteroidota bacterium]|nr:phosphoribosylformylglycinamidine synthase subunit PurL [Bacteroidota bacterium]MDW8138300.1 phosphoribosylformylglycinamidine synthase subunit PurL [Bacteroidota bacterium]